ncbi:MAG: virulence RhuM family protein [Bacteroidota bacterium]|nr:virulence RhuM family protein [Bacteroidota bacterium]
MTKKKSIRSESGFNEILLYTTPNGKVKVEIYLQNETIWLSQQKIADLFGVQRPAISKHLKNIFETGELKEEMVSSILEHTTQHGAIEGKTQEKKVKYYNLDAIISVGYRVNSSQATAFRIWATERLKEYIIKGFTMDDERLKNPINLFGKDYFDEQLARIRDIRSSERRFYQKITDIYTQCSADYNLETQTTIDFFATVQNKLHWAITGQTAAELIATRADSAKENMGLKTWKNAPQGIIRKSDIGIAKNYLNETELNGLNRIVSMYLDFAENQAMKGVVMYMKDWTEKLDAFLQFNDVAVLKHLGKVSHDVALALAESEYEKYRVLQDKEYKSDFDLIVNIKTSKNTPLNNNTSND